MIAWTALTGLAGLRLTEVESETETRIWTESGQQPYL